MRSSDWSRVVAIGRGVLGISHPKLLKVQVDFDHLDEYRDKFVGDVLFSCMGTTMKKAGSKEAFRQVDYDYVINTAKIAAENQVKRILVVSALGADAKSSIFYNKVKGEMEWAIAEMPFEAVRIFRPSLLLGDRKENRTGEKMGQSIARTLPFLFSGPLKKYQAIEAKAVAQAMLVVANAGILEGVKVHESNTIQDIADGLIRDKTD